MGCFTGNVKYVFFVFNFLIVECGITLIALGRILLVNENQGIASFTHFSVGNFSIAVGIIIFCVVFFGCCGAIKENSCMLTVYTVALVVLLILQIVFGSLAFIELRNSDYKILGVVDDVFQTKDNKEVIDHIQQYFKCCGPFDWSPSCYGDSFYQESCAEAFKDAVVYKIKAIASVAIVYAIIEFIGAVFFFYYTKQKMKVRTFSETNK